MKRKALKKAERLIIYNKTDGHCAYCGEKIEIKAMQVDHVAPMEYAGIIEKDGHDPNHADNLLPACRPCNYIKSTMPIERFRYRISKWPDTLQASNVTYRNAIRFGTVVACPHRVTFYFEKIGLNVPDYLEGLNLMYKEQK